MFAPMIAMCSSKLRFVRVIIPYSRAVEPYIAQIVTRARAPVVCSATTSLNYYALLMERLLTCFIFRAIGTCGQIRSNGSTCCCSDSFSAACGSITAPDSHQTKTHQAKYQNLNAYGNLNVPQYYDRKERDDQVGHYSVSCDYRYQQKPQ